MYKGYGVYRFLDEKKHTIYIGRSKNIYSRIYSQHFTSRGHLPYMCYKNTCRVDVIKLNNNIECKALEDYLIQKYQPRYNKQDKLKGLNNSFGVFEDQLIKMEKWKSYRNIKPFNDRSIKESKRDAIAAYIFCWLFFLGIIYQFILK